jgi:rhomboid protease GluP
MGAGAAVLLLTSNRLLVGASGSIMALVGAAAAIALRAWLREKAPYASRRFFQFLIVIVAQTLFDIFTPRVSFLAHGAGLLLGFLMAIVLPHGAATRQPDQRASF